MRVSGPRSLRAMAHPLRLDLIELLGTLGPATAAECARQLGSTQASCSYHLRQLEAYGFVEQADPPADARQRPWRLTDIEQSWSSQDDSPAARELERVFVHREADRILGWQNDSGQQPAQWRDAAFLGGATVPMTAEELRQAREDMYAVLAPYVDRLRERSDWPSDHRFVRILLAGTPGTADAPKPNSPDSEGTR